VTVEAFLNSYGLPAIFVLMLVKAAGVPIPVPADVVMLFTATRVVEGKLAVADAFLVLLTATVTGGLVQFILARGFGRGFLYRVGRYVGLTSARLDAATTTVKRGGMLAVALGIVTPGIRAATVAASGLANLPLRIFVPGLILGNGGFLGLHFALAYVGGQIIGQLLQALPYPVLGVVLLLLAGLAVWVVIRRRQRSRATLSEVLSEAHAAWEEATCPACLLLGAAAGPIHRAVGVEMRTAEANG
jgi:membrane protein DedA with SNARE-associated domain